MKIVVTLPDNSVHEVNVHSGESVMESIRRVGLPIRAECGGAMACATCHVHVDPAWIVKTGAAEGDERDLLNMSDYSNALSRLSCQIVPTSALDGLSVTLQPDAFEG